MPQTWAPGNTAGCPAPRRPGRTCDSPSGCRPRTGAPLHHPVETKRTSVFVSVRASVDAVRLCIMSIPNVHTHAHTNATSKYPHTTVETLCDHCNSVSNTLCVILWRYFQMRDSVLNLKIFGIATPLF